MKDAFLKKFWKEVFEDPYSIVINGNGYTFGSGVILKSGERFGQDGAFRGFAGRTFKIEILETTLAFDKGTIIETKNLWHRGEVPDWCNMKDSARTTQDSPTRL